MESPTKSPRKRSRANENSVTAKALKFFEQIEFNSGAKPKTHICNLCNELCNGLNKWNLASHLSHCHPKEYAEINSERGSLALQRLKLLHNCTEIVTVNGRAFSCLHDSGFQGAIRNILDELRAAKIPLNLSDNNLTVIKDQIIKSSTKIREKIQSEVRGRPLSLLVDIVTKHKRSILGVSIQYNFNGNLRVRSIGFIELWDRHTGKYLAEVIINRLDKFGIKLKQIFTITTDNGKNVLKLVRDMSEYLQTISITEQQQTPQKQSNQNQSNPIQSNQNQVQINRNDEEQTDAAIADFLTDVKDLTDEEALDLVMDEVSLDHETLLEAMVQEISDIGVDIEWDITGVNCAAHTLQLGVKDSLTALSLSHTNVLLLSREVCKFLNNRTTVTDLKIRGIEYSLPRIETKTRWSSMYLMVNLLCIYLFHVLIQYFLFQLSDIKACENVIKHLADIGGVQMCKLLLKKWNILREIVHLLQIPFTATLAFQNKKLTLSEVYGRWVGIQLHLEACLTKKSYKTGYAKLLLNALKNRNEIIFNNPLMSCALYLDPKFHRKLNEYPEKMEQAKKNILKIWRRLIALRELNPQHQEQTETTANVSTDSFEFDFNEEDAVSKFVQGKTNELQNNVTSTTSKDRDVDIEMEIELFQPSSEQVSSVVEYWENLKEEQNVLYEVAMVIFSVPPTEVQIERDFSALDFIFTKRRGNMSENRLEDIFLIHLNKDLFYLSNQDEINELKTATIESI